MIVEVLLVFSLNGQMESVSDRVFNSLDECAEFVNAVANADVVNSDYGFRFVAPDGMLFDGQCIHKSDWLLKKGTTEI